VRADKLDHLIDLIGELVIAGSGAQMVANQNTRPPSWRPRSACPSWCRPHATARWRCAWCRWARPSRASSAWCATPASSWARRSTSVVTGGDTELDKSMVEVIADPLMHLVRNSLDHGIEVPAERAAAGKPAPGRLGLNAYHEGGSIVIEVSDDGRGLRRERILAKAIERGLVAEARS
jgi:two-component system, chemotaxis family, sensor kinase CheA